MGRFHGLGSGADKDRKIFRNPGPTWASIKHIQDRTKGPYQDQTNYGILGPNRSNWSGDSPVHGFLGTTIDLVDKRHTRVYSLVNLEVVIQVVLLNCKNNNTSLLTLLSSVKFESDDIQWTSLELQVSFSEVLWDFFFQSQPEPSWTLIYSQ